MKHKRSIILTLSFLTSISFLLSACAKNYEKDSGELLRLQINASEAESIKEEVEITEVTTATSVEPTKETTIETTVETTIETTVAPTTTETTVKPTTVKPTTVAPTAKPTQPIDPSGHVTPVVNAQVTSEGVLVSWNPINASDFNGYKVVLSKSNPNPKYSEDGYAAFITNASQTSYLVKPNQDYNRGDVGGKTQAGVTYYFSVTALYADHSVKIAGNAVQVMMPGTYVEPTPAPSYPVPTVGASHNGTTVVVTWNPISDARFDGYKVVMSSTNPNPVYPADSYEAWITDANVSSFAIDSNRLVSGTTYYFSVTALYDGQNAKIPGNAVAVTIP